jgi:ADP-ribosylglycohydrolase
MMLCLATSLIDYNGKHDSFDQVRNYLAWFRDGRFSSVGECFDIGNATSSVLGRWWTELERYDSGPNSKSDERVTKAEKQGAWEREKERASVQDRVTSPFTEEQYCGNGSLMRVLPCALMGVDEEHAVDLATRSSATTHPHLRCVDACEIYTRVVYWILQGLVEKEEMAGKLYSLITQDRLDTVLRERLRKYPSLSSWKSTSVHQISSSGYVLDTLEASLWAIFTTATFRDGALKVVNLGDDADTVGAIYGGLAGMFYGIEEVPGEWLGVLMGLGTVEGVVRGILGFRGRREEQRQ